MRGVPNHPVVCVACGSPKGVPKDGLCMACRMDKRRKYVWTPALDAELRTIYATTNSRASLSAALRAFKTRMGWPRGPIAIRAVELGITVIKKYWSPAELEFLRQNAGRRSMYFITAKLKRSMQGVRCQLQRMGLPTRFEDGYSISALAEVFGVSNRTVARWISRRWLRPDMGLVPETLVRKFLRQHAEEYDLRRVDQAWFKGMIFPSFGYHAHGMGDGASHNPYEEVA
jgi:hypothetical protein